MSNAEKEIHCKLFNLKEWISDFSLDDAKRRALCFRETLIILSKNESTTDTKPIGGYCVLVEPMGPQGRELLVHVQSSMSIDGHFGGSKVISSATEKFHCLEEKRTEFVYREGGLHEKSIFIGIQENFYHVKLTTTCPCDKTTETKDLSFCCNNKLISEGVNILLMRYLAITNFQGSLCLESINLDGDITTSNYNCTPAEDMEIDGYFLKVYTIERKMHTEGGSVNTIITYLTTKGRILQHNWLDVPYILKINPLCNPKITQKTMKIEAPLRDRWTKDIEMVSKYLDVKFSKIAQKTEYLADYPEIKHMIADYTQTLLVVKPANVIDFTIQHFKAFAKDPKVWETSMLEDTCDTDIKSQLTNEKSQVICDICGFYIDQAVLDEIFSTESVKGSPKIMSLHDSATSSQASHWSHEKDSTPCNSNMIMDDFCTTQEFAMTDLLTRIKQACEQCRAIVKSRQTDSSHTK